MCLAWIRTFDHVFVETTGTVPTRPFYQSQYVVINKLIPCPRWFSIAMQW